MEKRLINLIGVIALVVIVIIEVLYFFGKIPPYLIPYLQYINNNICVILVIILILIIIIMIVRCKEGIRKARVNRAYKKLECKITKELENEATAKNLILKDGIITTLAKQVTFNITNVSTPKDYSVQPATDKDGDVWIGGEILSIPLVSAKILADKMTELSKDPRYRKKKII